jgi:hypothetical protein
VKDSNQPNADADAAAQFASVTPNSSFDISPAVFIPPYPVAVPKPGMDGLCFLLFLENDMLCDLGRLIRREGIPFDLCSALADKLDPLSKNMVRYIWKRHHGRPSRHHGTPTDAIEAAIEAGDLPVIATHLRDTELPDPRVISWLADQFDPPSERHSHFVIKAARKARSRSAVLTAEAMRIGAIVDREFQKSKKLEAALQYVMTQSAEVPVPVTRSTARRAYKLYRRTRPIENIVISMD